MGVKKVPSRWVIMAVALFYMAFAGAGYAFGLISDTLKSRMNLSQSQIDVISVSGSFGAGSTAISGVFNNRYGPSISIWFGIFFVTIGWGILTLFTTQIIDISSYSYAYILTAIPYFIYNHGLTWLFACAAPTIAQNFPKQDHGKYLGLAKSYLGLGTAFIATFKTDLANGNVNIFMFSVLIYIPITCIIFSPFLKQIPDIKYVNKYNENENYKNRKYWYISVCALVMYLILMLILQNTLFSENYRTSNGIALFVAGQLLFFSPLIIAKFNHGPFWVNVNVTSNIYNEASNEPLLENDNDDESSIESETTIDIGMPDILKTWDFWLLYISFIIVTGCPSTFNGNIAQIVESALSSSSDDDTHESIVTSLVMVISIANFAGRIFVGYISDKYIDKVHKTFWNMFATLGMCLTTLFIFGIGFVFDSNDNKTAMIIGLYVASFMTGFSFGWMYSIILIEVCYLWGTRYLSGNFGLFDFCVSIGQLLFSNGLFANLYQYEGRKLEHDDNKCYGGGCFAWTFLICSGCCLIAFVMNYVLWRRNRLR